MQPSLPSALLCAALLAGCGGRALEPGQDIEAASAAAPATLIFARGFSTSGGEALQGGQTVTLQYDRLRMYDVVDGSASVGLFASRHHCYGYGCCDVRFDEVYAHWRTDDGAFTAARLDDGDSAQLVLPNGAERLEVFFSTPGYQLKTWYCGCGPQCAADNRDRAGYGFQSWSAYDSRFGDNYVFEVQPAAPAVQVAHKDHGQWKSNYSAPSGVRYGWFWDANVWVDVTTPAEGERTVGVRWTVDGWATYTDSYASFEGVLPSGEAQWGVDVTPAYGFGSCYWCEPEQVTFEYAAFVVVDGQTYWDNNDGANHRLSLDPEY